MIVVVGSAGIRLPDASGEPAALAGLGALIGASAAAAGASVQLVGKVGDDDVGDGVLLELGRLGVGHVALLRDPARSTTSLKAATPDDGDALEDSTVDGEGAPWGPARSAGRSFDRPVLDAQDVDLALRYLTDFAVLVVVEPVDAETARVVADAAAWTDSQLVMILSPGAAVPDGLPPGVVVFEAPDDDPEGTFATLVGTFAAALDDGAEAGVAFRSTLAAEGWTESDQEPGEA